MITGEAELVTYYEECMRWLATHGHRYYPDQFFTDFFAVCWCELNTPEDACKLWLDCPDPDGWLAWIDNNKPNPPDEAE